MKILIFEYVCGGGFQGESPPSELLEQGKEMLCAALADFSRLPDPTQVYTLIEERFAFGLPGAARRRHPGPRWRADWLGLVRQCDAALVIAPESERSLEDLCAEVLRLGRTSLNCSVDAIRLAADKWTLARHLREAGIPAVETESWDPARPLPDAGVIKPRYGAGCEDTYALGGRRDVPASAGPWIWQPWVPGQAASLSILAGAGDMDLLSCNKIDCQNRGGKLHVKKIETGGFDDDARFRAVARELAGRIGETVPGLRGYVGVDVMWDDGAMTVLEINPRLTLSYAGQSAPLAERMLQAFGCTVEEA